MHSPITFSSPSIHGAPGVIARSLKIHDPVDLLPGAPGVQGNARVQSTVHMRIDTVEAGANSACIRNLLYWADYNV